MIGWLERFIPSGEGQKEEQVRSAYGKAASIVSIGCNVLLFAGKALAGVISGSVAVTADAFNNLSDASSGVVSLLGFKLAEKPADAEHPYGHGRFEYLSALLVAVMVLVIGFELLKGSVEKIISPSPVDMSPLTIGILVVSIAAKLWLSLFNRKVGEKIGSATLTAAADDSRNDVMATAAVLLAMLIAHFTGLMLDGVIGAAVAVFILVSGFGLVKDTIDPMLGSMPTREQVDRIREKIMAYPGVLGIHDLMVHDYGPGRQFASVHVEMSASEDPLVCHDLLDNIERDFFKQDGLHLVIHYDPVVTDDPRLPVLRAFVSQVAGGIHPEMTVHDLRIVPGKTHTNIVFDCVVPYTLDIPFAHLRSRTSTEVEAHYPNHYCVITFERSYAQGVQ